MDNKPLNSEELSNTINPLSREELDTLGELGNISIGTSATTLYSLLGNKVIITTPRVNITSVKELGEKYPIPFVSVEIEYTRGLNGSNLMIIREEDAKVIADMMMGGDGKNVDFELDELRLSAVGEAMNQMMGSSSTSLSTMLKKDINISPPKLHRVNLATGPRIGKFADDEKIVQVSFQMNIGDFLESEIMQLMPIDFARDVVAELNAATQYDLQQSVGGTPKEPQMEDQVGEETAAGLDSAVDTQIPTASYYGQLQDLRPKVTRLKEGSKNKMTEDAQKVEVRPVTFEEFEPADTATTNSNLDIIIDVPLEVTVELGRTSKTIKEILELGPGYIVELDKMAGEPVDILVNGKFVAKGEVVVIDENFGVRIIDITSSLDRIDSIQ